MVTKFTINVEREEGCYMFYIPGFDTYGCDDDWKEALTACIKGFIIESKPIDMPDEQLGKSMLEYKKQFKELLHIE